MYADENLQEIRVIAKKCLMNLGPLELAEPSDLYPLVAISSDETKITRFTKSVVLVSQELTVLTEPALMPPIPGMDIIFVSISFIISSILSSTD
jgi:hypothetical protein